MFKTRTLFQLFLIVLFSLNLTGCSAAFIFGSKNKNIAAKVNGEIITKEDFIRKLESVDFVTKDNKEEEQKTKRETLGMLIADILVEQKAKKLDLSGDEGWKKREEKHSLEFLVELLYRKEITEKVQVQDSEITAFYEENQDELFTKTEQYKISHILVKMDTLQKENPEMDKEAERKALEKIESIYQRAISGEDFSGLARQFSEEEKTKYKGGLLGYLPRGRMIKEFEEQVASIQPGEVSKPFRTEYGYHILKYTDKIPEVKMELNQDLENRIRLSLAQKKQNEKAKEYLEDLKNRTNYLYNEEVLEQPQDSVKGNPWVLIMDEQDTIKYSKYVGDVPRYKGYFEKDTLNLEEKKLLLRNYSSFFNILVLEGRRLGYEEHPEYVKEIDDFKFKEARRRILAEGKLKHYTPSDEEIYDYYLAHRNEFPADSSLHVHHIIFTDSLKAEEVLKRIQEGADFMEMVKEYYPGEKEIREVAYDLGFITDVEISPEFYKAAAQLEIGEISHPVRTEWGYHLIRLVERREGSPVELFKSRLMTLVKLERQSEIKAEWEKGLRKGQEIWINEKLVKKLKIKPEE